MDEPSTSEPSHSLDSLGPIEQETVLRADRVFSISASQLLQASATAIRTGLSQLDEAVGPAQCKGIPRGRVAEVFGPPGVGKTSLA